MLASAAIRDIPLVLLLPVIGFTQQAPAKPLAIPPSQKTLFVNCQANEKPKKVLSPVSLSEDSSANTRPKDAHRERIVEDQRLRVVQLVRSPPQGDAQGGLGGLGFDHENRLLLGVVV